MGGGGSRPAGHEAQYQGPKGRNLKGELVLEGTKQAGVERFLFGEPTGPNPLYHRVD